MDALRGTLGGVFRRTPQQVRQDKRNDALTTFNTAITRLNTTQKSSSKRNRSVQATSTALKTALMYSDPLTDAQITDLQTIAISYNSIKKGLQRSFGRSKTQDSILEIFRIAERRHSTEIDVVTDEATGDITVIKKERPQAPTGILDLTNFLASNDQKAQNLLTDATNLVETITGLTTANKEDLSGLTLKALNLVKKAAPLLKNPSINQQLSSALLSKVRETVNVCLTKNIEFAGEQPYRSSGYPGDKGRLDSRLKQLVDRSTRLVLIEEPTFDALQTKYTTAYTAFMGKIESLANSKTVSDEEIKKAIDDYRDLVRPFEKNKSSLQMSIQNDPCFGLTRSDLQTLVKHARKIAELRTQINAPASSNTNRQLRRLRQIQEKTTQHLSTLNQWPSPRSSWSFTSSTRVMPVVDKTPLQISTLTDILDGLSQNITTKSSAISNPNRPREINAAINTELGRRRHLLSDSVVQAVIQKQRGILSSNLPTLLPEGYRDPTDTEIDSFLETPLSTRERKPPLQIAWETWLTKKNPPAEVYTERTPNRMFQPLTASNPGMSAEHLKMECKSHFKIIHYVDYLLENDRNIDEETLTRSIHAQFPSINLTDIRRLSSEVLLIHTATHREITEATSNASAALRFLFETQTDPETEEITFKPIDDLTIRETLRPFLTEDEITHLLTFNITREDLAHHVRWDGQNIGAVAANLEETLQQAQKGRAHLIHLGVTRDSLQRDITSHLQEYNSLFRDAEPGAPLNPQTLKKLIDNALTTHNKCIGFRDDALTGHINSLIVDLFLQKSKLTSLLADNSPLNTSFIKLETLLTTEVLEPASILKLMEAADQRLNNLKQSIATQDNVTDAQITATINDYLSIYETVKSQVPLSLDSLTPGDTSEKATLCKAFLGRIQGIPIFTERGLRQQVLFGQGNKLRFELQTLYQQISSSEYSESPISEKLRLLNTFDGKLTALLLLITQIPNPQSITYQNNTLEVVFSETRHIEEGETIFHHSSTTPLDKIVLHTKYEPAAQALDIHLETTNYLQGVSQKRELLAAQKDRIASDIVQTSTETVIKQLIDTTTHKVLEESIDAPSPELSPEERATLQRQIETDVQATEANEARLILDSFIPGFAKQVDSLIDSLERAPGLSSQQMKLFNLLIQNLDITLGNSETRATIPEYITCRETLKALLQTTKERLTPIPESEYLAKLRVQFKDQITQYQTDSLDVIGNLIRFSQDTIVAAQNESRMTNTRDQTRIMTLDGKQYKESFGGWQQINPNRLDEDTLSEMKKQYLETKRLLDIESLRINTLNEQKSNIRDQIDRAIQTLNENPSIVDMLAILYPLRDPISTPELSFNQLQADMLKTLKKHTGKTEAISTVDSALRPHLEKINSILFGTDWNQFVNDSCRAKRFTKGVGSRKQYRPSRENITSWQRAKTLDSLTAIATARGESLGSTLNAKLSTDRSFSTLNDDQVTELIELAYRIHGSEVRPLLSTLEHLEMSIKEKALSVTTKEEAQKIVLGFQSLLTCVNPKFTHNQGASLFNGIRTLKTRKENAKFRYTKAAIEQKVGSFISQEKFDVEAAVAAGFPREQMTQLQARHFTKKKALKSLSDQEGTSLNYEEARGRVPEIPL